MTPASAKDKILVLGEVIRSSDHRRWEFVVASEDHLCLNCVVTALNAKKGET
jgi:hypothetical protein